MLESPDPQERLDSEELEKLVEELLWIWWTKRQWQGNIPQTDGKWGLYNLELLEHNYKSMLTQFTHTHTKMHTNPFPGQWNQCHCWRPPADVSKPWSYWRTRSRTWGRNPHFWAMFREKNILLGKGFPPKTIHTELHFVSRFVRTVHRPRQFTDKAQEGEGKLDVAILTH